MQARQIARRKRKELGQEPPRGYILQDAFRLWCNLKRGRIVSYMDEKRQLDEITAPLIIATVRHIEAAGHQATLKRVLMRTREIMDLAVCAGYILHNPIDRVSRVFGTTGYGHFASITLQAKRSSDAYGNSTTVQPALMSARALSDFGCTLEAAPY